MVQCKKKLNWSGLCTDLLRLVFERLSFTDLSRAKSVCRSWHSASRGCVPKRNQIPWLILFPGSNKNTSCLLYVPDDRDKCYETRDLGVDFVQSTCLATYGSWLLMMDVHWNLNILNLLTGERIDLPLTDSVAAENFGPRLKSSIACLWVDEETKEYLVVWKMVWFLAFTKKGINMWRRMSSNSVGRGAKWHEQMIYNHKAQKLYIQSTVEAVKIWRFCEDDPQEVFEDKYSSRVIGFLYTDFLPENYVFIRKSDLLPMTKSEELYWEGEQLVDGWVNIAITVSGEVLKVASAVQRSKRWLFRIFKTTDKTSWWKRMDSLGDESLILDMGITVVAKDIPGIKRNSIYFSGVGYGRRDPDHIFVYDLTTHETETLPQSILSPIHFSDARWFFPH